MSQDEPAMAVTQLHIGANGNLARGANANGSPGANGGCGGDAVPAGNRENGVLIQWVTVAAAARVVADRLTDHTLLFL
jgi:hypothetical protein